MFNGAVSGADWPAMGARGCAAPSFVADLVSEDTRGDTTTYWACQHGLDGAGA